MITVAAGPQLLAVNILSQAGTEAGRLQIVDGQSIAGQQGMAVSLPDEKGHGVAAVPVKNYRRPQYPDDAAMFPVMRQYFVEGIVTAGKGALPAAAAAESRIYHPYQPDWQTRRYGHKFRLHRFHSCRLPPGRPF